MTDNFDAYIDSLGPLRDEDLYKDIDETMESRKRNEGAGEENSSGSPEEKEAI